MRLTAGIPTTIAMDTQPIPTSLTIRPRSTPWWKPTALLDVLQTWITSVAQSQASVRQAIRPDCPRQETPVDILARKHTFLYACSLMG
jgi:hypothetical protein